MPTLAQTIKDEIRRISRREIVRSLSNFRRDHIALKKRLAEQKRRIFALEKENKVLAKQQAAFSQAHPLAAAPEPDAEPIVVYAKGIKSLRRRLGLSQTDLGKLVGANMKTVALWEKKSGKITIRRPDVRKSLKELKGLKKAAVKTRLEELSAAKK
jgi:DNA-binding XRE family transcriptional regulator